MITQAQREAIRRDFSPGTVPIMLLDELEQVEATAARAELAACRHETRMLRAERNQLQLKIQK